MRSLFAIIFTALIFGTATIGFAKHHRNTKPHQEVEVQITHEKVVNGFKIKFVDLVEDSRCPTDTNCVWAGNAKIKVRLKKNGKTKDVELNTGRGLQTVKFEGYEFTLAKLLPAPASNIRIRKDGYVATFKVVKHS